MADSEGEAKIQFRENTLEEKQKCEETETSVRKWRNDRRKKRKKEEGERTRGR